MAPRLSVIIITRNEAANLRRCLESVRFADEIIINDTGSTDGTQEIAREFECTVIQNSFDGFGVAKQQALDAATGDWVLSIDADEELDAQLQAHIKQVVEKADVDGYLMNRKSQFLGQWIEHSGWYPDRILRLFRRRAGKFTDARVHERIVVSGATAILAGHLLHYSFPHLSSYLAKMDRYSTLAAESMHATGKPFRRWKLIFKPPAVFFKMYILRQGFRDGLAGLVLAVLSALDMFVRYVKLWQLERR